MYKFLEKKIVLLLLHFKSGQTKLKSVLVDFLVTAGIKPVSIVSYNHLGNNDGKNLSAPDQFRSKEASKFDLIKYYIFTMQNIDFYNCTISIYLSITWKIKL